MLFIIYFVYVQQLFCFCLIALALLLAVPGPVSTSCIDLRVFCVLSAKSLSLIIVSPAILLLICLKANTVGLLFG